MNNFSLPKFLLWLEQRCLDVDESAKCQYCWIKRLNERGEFDEKREVQPVNELEN